MYELADYLAMVEDTVRTPAYLAAIRAVVRPGDRVLDLGTGFGYFAVAAVRAGAAQVVAVEPNDAIGLGRAIAEANGCADRITFIQARADRVTLDTRADVLLEDLRGMSPLHGPRLAVLRDAHARLLAPGARTIPLRDALIVAPAELPSDLRDHTAAQPRTPNGIDVAPVHARLARGIRRTRGSADALLAPGAAWTTLDYAVPTDGHPQGRATFVVTRAGRFAGLLSWFEATLAPGIVFDTAPGGARTVYDRAFLPIGAPIDVRPDDRITVDIRTRFDGREHVWVWEVTVESADGVTQRRCSNLEDVAMTAVRRARRASDHVPVRSGEIVRLGALADLVDGVRSLDAVADGLLAAPGTAFGDAQAALRWAAERIARADEDVST